MGEPLTKEREAALRWAANAGHTFRASVVVALLNEIERLREGRDANTAILKGRADEIVKLSERLAQAERETIQAVVAMLAAYTGRASWGALGPQDVIDYFERGDWRLYLEREGVRRG